jgi:Mrp family chromosome partitioning ATPase
VTKILDAIHPSRTRVLLVLSCGLAGAAFGGLVALTERREYEAAAHVVVRESRFGDLVLATPAGSSANVTGDTRREMKLARLRAVADLTAQRSPGLGLGGRAIARRVSISGDDESGLIKVAARDLKTARATQLATAYAQAFVAFRTDAEELRLRDSEAVLLRQIRALAADEQPARRQGALREQLDRLRLVRSLAIGNRVLAPLEVVESVPPASRVARPVGRNAVIGGLAGLLLGVVLLPPLELVRARRIKDVKELEQMFGAPTLAEVANSPPLRRAASEPAALRAGEREAFGLLTRQLLEQKEKLDTSSFAIGSIARWDGKTTVAWNIARAAALAGSRVLLIEANARHRHLARALGLEPDGGGRERSGGRTADLRDAVRTIDVSDDPTTRRRAATVDVIIFEAGEPEDEADTATDDKRITALIRQAEGQYDLILIEVPAGPDGLTIAKEAGALVIVARPRETWRKAASRLQRELDAIRVPVVGLVPNRSRELSLR